MLRNNARAVPANLFEGFEKDSGGAEALAAFESALMVAYEQALDNGVCPSMVLAVMLDMAAREARRLIAERPCEH
jgi:hypothetical protein